MIQALVIGVLCGSALGGPDLICSEISEATSYGLVDGMAAYSFGTTLCNIGDEPVPNAPDTNQHPLISQSIYRLRDHRIEQIGIGFVRHTTIPLAGNACGLGCMPAGIDALGAGCSDTSSSAINGSQSMLGPRSEVNAFTAEYPYPFTSMNQTGDAIYKRVQVALADVSDPDALYFVETQVIVPGETTADARNNNVSYRQVVFAPGSANATLVGPTYEQQPAIFAWRDHGNGIGVPDPSVLISLAPDPFFDGLLGIGSRATEVADDLWEYTYEIYNMNGEGGVFLLLLPQTGDRDASLVSTEFRATRYHDSPDDDFSDSEWVHSTSREFSNYYIDYQIKIAESASSPIGNTVRWGTMYGFSFTLSTISTPGMGSINIRSTMPGPSDSRQWDYIVIAPSQGPTLCPADLNDDGMINFFDVSRFIKMYLDGADFNEDTVTNFFDISSFIQEYNACPGGGLHPRSH